MRLDASHIATCTGARIDRASALADGMNDAMELFGMGTPVRQAMFLANIGHETGGLKYLAELWGPTDQQRRYERNFSRPWPETLEQSRLPQYAANRLAWSLGNYMKGDGERYKGHGLLQNTGRGNHARTRDRLRRKFPQLPVPDFEARPELLATPEWAAITAGDYCDMKNCNAMADAGDFDGYCDLINRGRKTEDEGDSNGFEHRLALYERGYPFLLLLHDTPTKGPTP